MEVITEDILQLSALVAAYVSVIRAYGLSDKHAPLGALLVAAIFVLVPSVVQEKLTLISVVGLTAAGVYNYVRKPKA
jgi:predicted metal-binding membrane protein